MKKQTENEELQSRREFFKQAAKKVLPVVGAIALASSPILAQATEKESMGCNTNCQIACAKGCYIFCEGTCKDTCLKTCKGTCVGGCKRTCKDLSTK